MTQGEKIIAYIKEFGSITAFDAYTDLGIMRLASRIHDLTEQGYVFKRETVKSKNRYGETIHYTRYSL